MLPELDNLRAAHAWAIGEAGDPQVAIALAAHAGSLIDYAVECADWLLPLRQHVEDGAVDPAVAARYWRAIAASNMVGRVPRALQAEAAIRARYAVPGARPAAPGLFQPDPALAAPQRAARATRPRRRPSTRRGASSGPTGPPSSAFSCCAATASLAREAGRFAEALALLPRIACASALRRGTGASK